MGYDDKIASLFRDRVKAERTAREWSQARLAEEMTNRGVITSWPAIHKIEAGSRAVRISEAAAIADSFGISLDRLLRRRARPASDRDFALRQLQATLDDSARVVRTALRAVADRVAEADDGNDTELIASVQAACDQLDTDALALAQCAGAVAERRAGHHRVLRVQRMEWTAKDNDNA